MSIECDTSLFGVIRPAPERLEERGKCLKSEPKPEPKPKAVWELKSIKNLTLSDFSIYDDDVKPFHFACERFVYKNKAMIQKNKEDDAAMADYKKRSGNLSGRTTQPFDAIARPKGLGIVGGSVPTPLTMTDDLRVELSPLCKLALDKFNAQKNQESENFVFLDIVKTTWKPGGFYYMTFQAQKDLPNCTATTFQAKVWKTKIDKPHKVISCSRVTT